MAIISKAVASADLLGMRVFKISAHCPPTLEEDHKRVKINLQTTSKVEKISGKKPAAFAELTLSIDTDGEDDEVHRLFEIEVHGAYIFSENVNANVMKDKRFIHMLCRPLYATAIFEFRKMSAAMDVGNVYVSTEMPWPEGVPRNLDDEMKSILKKLPRPIKETK